MDVDGCWVCLGCVLEGVERGAGDVRGVLEWVCEMLDGWEER